MVRRRFTGICACALAFGCGSSDPPDSASDTNQSGDPQWGEGFATRSSDGGDPDAPSSVAQACALFGGPPWDFASIADVKQRLTSRTWIGCGDDSLNTNGFWPAGFVFTPDGRWQALVRASDGSMGPATEGHAAGTYEVDDYAIDMPQYAAMFILHFLPDGAANEAQGEQWEGYFEDSPEILYVDSSTGTDAYRFSSAPP